MTRKHNTCKTQFSKRLLPEIIRKLERAHIHHHVHFCHSEEVLVDIFFEEKTYVIRIDGDVITLTRVTLEMSPFDNIPDKLFSKTNEFKAEFNKLFE